jgi:transcriptional regulator with XRE-family HTH domain
LQLSPANLAAQVRARAESRGLSLADVARAAGLSPQHLHNLLTVTRDPRASALVALAAALGCRVDDLLEPA